MRVRQRFPIASQGNRVAGLNPVEPAGTRIAPQVGMPVMVDNPQPRSHLFSLCIQSMQLDNFPHVPMRRIEARRSQDQGQQTPENPENDFHENYDLLPADRHCMCIGADFTSRGNSINMAPFVFRPAHDPMFPAVGGAAFFNFAKAQPVELEDCRNQRRPGHARHAGALRDACPAARPFR